MTSLHIHNKLERQKVTSQNKKSHFFYKSPHSERIGDSFERGELYVDGRSGSQRKSVGLIVADGATLEHGVGPAGGVVFLALFGL